MKQIGAPVPRHLQRAAEITVNADLLRHLSDERPSADRVQKILEMAAITDAQLDAATLEFALRGRINELARRFGNEPARSDLLQSLREAIGVARMLPFQVNLWTAQNCFYHVLHSFAPALRSQAEQGDPAAQMWFSDFQQLADQLSVRVG
jgi:hypothetical protein